MGHSSQPEYGHFHHTAPYHPTSNGAAEKSVKVIKQAMRKMGTSVRLKEQLVEFLLFMEPHNMQ